MAGCVRVLALRVSVGVFACAAVAAGAAPLPPPPPGVQTIDRYGIEFSVVGMPGNAPYDGGSTGVNAGAGSVNHEFAIARTQVTNAQWVEFANAYRPYIKGDPDFRGIAEGILVRYDAGEDRYFALPGTEQVAATMSWRMAARYVNWLHNDKRTDAAAFASGAYDTTTFTPDAGSPFNDQLERSPGARFFLPTRDEWVKAAFFDPNRDGMGAAGYWTYPNRTDQPLRYGFPAEGGESIVGAEGIPPFSWYLPVASYLSTQSPWGLFDLSGSSADWNEDATIDRSSRFWSGTGRRDIVPDLSDSLLLGFPYASWPYDSLPQAGLRLAFLVPAPTSPFVLVLIGFCRSRRRPRCTVAFVPPVP